MNVVQGSWVLSNLEDFVGASPFVLNSEETTFTETTKFAIKALSGAQNIE